MKKYKLLSNEITDCNYDDILDKIVSHISGKKQLLICPVATYALTKAFYDHNLQVVLRKFLLIPDSQWVKNAIRVLYGVNNIKKLRAVDLMRRVFEFSQKNKYKIFLYGTTKNTLKKLKLNLQKLYPSANIVGMFPSNFYPLNVEEKKDLISLIERTSPDILFVGLGSPLQETFAYELMHSKPFLKKSIVAITVGAAFDFLAHTKKEAPVWVQESGLEWLFRLFCEPKRLWERYLIYGPIFLVLVIIQKFSLTFKI